MDETGARAAGLEAELDEAMSLAIAGGKVELPPYPAVALRIAQLVRAGDFGLDELARLVASDQMLAADLLRAAQAAAYARGGPVTSLAQALARVGAEGLARIALASCLGATALAPGPLALLRRRTWQDALASAVLCRELARARRLPPDEAFTCGLLHDFGRVVAIGALERIASGARRPARPLPSRFWEAVVDRHHVALGVVLATKWSLPPAVRDCIARHHARTSAGAAHPELVDVVRAVDPIVAALFDRSHLPSAAAAARALSESDTEAVGRAISALPAFVAAFERPPAPADAALLEQAPRGEPRWAPRERLRFRVGEHVFDATGFAPHQLFVRGPAPLAEGALVEVVPVAADHSVVAPADAPPAFHARVLLSWPDGDGHGATLAPFALSGRSLQLWLGLVPQAAEA